MRIVVSSAAPALDDAGARFITKSRLVGGIREYDHANAPDRDVRLAGARDIASRPFHQSRAIPSNANRLLRIAWQTELAARVGEQLDDDALRLATLPTLPVQAYYAVFNAGRAFTHTAGVPKDKHTGLQTAFATEHFRRGPGALAVLLAGDPGNPGECTLTPAICEPRGFNQLEVRDNPADYVWAALRVARRWRVDRAKERWFTDSKNRTVQGRPYKVLPSRGRQEILAAERPTSLLDYLYALRCSTNYRSIDEYAIEIEPSHVRRFHSGMLHLMDAGLLCYEGQLALYAGSTALEEVFEDWATRVRSVGPWATEPGRARLHAIMAAGV